MSFFDRLRYRAERMFNGERGIVVKIEPALLADENKQFFNYLKDSRGALPQQVTFRNPIGELVTKLSPVTFGPERVTDFQEVYKDYKKGDEFP